MQNPPWWKRAAGSGADGGQLSDYVRQRADATANWGDPSAQAYEPVDATNQPTAPGQPIRQKVRASNTEDDETEDGFDDLGSWAYLREKFCPQTMKVCSKSAVHGTVFALQLNPGRTGPAATIFLGPTRFL
ncbi:uncharacterized protein N0V89_008701 [Didymosphaeria variabile]|uniref:Uncharacterized protein n=1 Tax=Didymosphaeria variabile TaxID=1932322 RepID=A0A9W8XGS3_9PLEO|nr:uncharacterized protein N0V89_008701 [Didymosphaeria variabile]KAJ4350080.1 hypothetical protein N0V89_008701 [Didymosphaeria variabile]